MQSVDQPVSSNPAVWAGFTAPGGGWGLGWKVTSDNYRTYNNFQWPRNGLVRANPRIRKFSHGDPCPQFPGDGLCVAKTWFGAASGGLPAHMGLAIAYELSAVLGGDVNKIRVRECEVLGVLDLQLLLRQGHGKGANLYGANLHAANLDGADLRGANLYAANLFDADLRGADLRGANLRTAELQDADLQGADLHRADLYCADLRGADLRGADLRGADLRFTVCSGWRA